MKVNKVQTEFLEPGFTLTEKDFAGFEEKFCNLVKEAKVVAMSGSVPKGLDGTAYQRLIKIVKEAGIRLFWIPVANFLKWASKHVRH